jgi:16S rRNA processing protein RimM
VTGLEVGPAQDLRVVSLDTGGDAYLPFVEAIVPEVDVARGRVVVDPPPGLLELNA